MGEGGPFPAAVLGYRVEQSGEFRADDHAIQRVSSRGHPFAVNSVFFYSLAPQHQTLLNWHFDFSNPLPPPPKQTLPSRKLPPRAYENGHFDRRWLLC